MPADSQGSGGDAHPIQGVKSGGEGNYREFQCHIGLCRFASPTGPELTEHVAVAHGISKEEFVAYPVSLFHHIDGINYAYSVFHIRRPVAQGEAFEKGKLVGVLLQQVHRDEDDPMRFTGG